MRDLNYSSIQNALIPKVTLAFKDDKGNEYSITPTDILHDALFFLGGYTNISDLHAKERGIIPSYFLTSNAVTVETVDSFLKILKENHFLNGEEQTFIVHNDLLELVSSLGTWAGAVLRNWPNVKDSLTHFDLMEATAGMGTDDFEQSKVLFEQLDGETKAQYRDYVNYARVMIASSGDQLLQAIRRLRNGDEHISIHLYTHEFQPVASSVLADRTSNALTSRANIPTQLEKISILRLKEGQTVFSFSYNKINSKAEQWYFESFSKIIATLISKQAGLSDEISIQTNIDLVEWEDDVPEFEGVYRLDFSEGFNFHPDHTKAEDILLIEVKETNHDTEETNTLEAQAS